jgi:hypothetical protein
MYCKGPHGWSPPADISTSLLVAGATPPESEEPLFLADLVARSHELVVNLEGHTFLGRTGPSGLELTRQLLASCRRDEVASEAAKELRLVLESLCVSEKEEAAQRLV